MIALVLVIAAGLAFIPASIAKRKGYNFGLWWFYGWMLWIVAIIHVNCIPDKGSDQSHISHNNSVPNRTPSITGLSAADELKKYKELYDSGIITEDEYQRKKKKLLDIE